MISAKSAILSSSQALATEVESTLSSIEQQVLQACSKNVNRIVTHTIVNHPSYLVRQAVYEHIRSLGYMIIREIGEEGYQWHTISWGEVEKPEEKQWWRIW
jgi:hypothetical protein